MPAQGRHVNCAGNGTRECQYSFIHILIQDQEYDSKLKTDPDSNLACHLIIIFERLCHRNFSLRVQRHPRYGCRLDNVKTEIRPAK